MKVKKGFTLIEVLITISIMSILSSVFIINGISYQNKAKQLKAINTAKQIKAIILSSYSQQGGNIIISDIQNTILNFTDINNINSSDIIKVDEKNIEVKFTSNKKNYIMDLNVDTNLCILKSENKVILNDTE